MSGRIDLNLFRILDAIHTHGSISAAARALHVTQPAVSHALNRLRESLGQPVFVRQGNRMIATEQTRLMLPQVQAHLNGLYAVLAPPAPFDPATLQRVFYVSVRDVLESILFPPLMQQVQQHAPLLTIQSQRVARDQFEQALIRRRLDVVVDRKHWVDSAIEHQTVGFDRQCVVVRQGHPCIDQGLNIEDYAKARHVAVSQPDAPESIDRWLGDQGITRQIALRCQHYFAACQVLVATDLMLTMPAAYAQELSRLLPLQIVDFPLTLAPIELVMYWHQSVQDDPAHQWLRQHIAQALPTALQGSTRAI